MDGASSQGRLLEDLARTDVAERAVQADSIAVELDVLGHPMLELRVRGEVIAVDRLDLHRVKEALSLEGEDDAYSESSFRTAKPRLGFPVNGFAELAAARVVLAFVRCYDGVHRNGSIPFATPK